MDEETIPEYDAEHAWMLEGLCRDRDPSFFFPSDGVGVDQRPEVCADARSRRSASSTHSATGSSTVSGVGRPSESAGGSSAAAAARPTSDPAAGGSAPAERRGHEMDDVVQPVLSPSVRLRTIAPWSRRGASVTHVSVRPRDSHTTTLHRRGDGSAGPAPRPTARPGAAARQRRPVEGAGPREDRRGEHAVAVLQLLPSIDTLRIHEHEAVAHAAACVRRRLHRRRRAAAHRRDGGEVPRGRIDA